MLELCSVTPNKIVTEHTWILFAFCLRISCSEGTRADKKKKKKKERKEEEEYIKDNLD